MNTRQAWFAGIGLIVGTALILLAMGRLPICACGTVKLWNPASAESGGSQHIADWYTLSHIIHGFIFYAILHFVQRQSSVPERALSAILIEATWEILENSPWVIDRYRQATVAANYNGDTVINSVSDILFMLVGFWFARKMPVAVTVAAAVLMEILALIVIRDNLTLNVLMLVYPLESIKQWQGG